MESFQNAVVGLLIFISALYLCRRAWLAMTSRKIAGCGSGCSKCPSATSDTSTGGKQLVGIGLEPEALRQER